MNWEQALAQLGQRWSHSQLPEGALAIYRSDLDEISASPDETAAAIKALDAGGREFVPSPGTVRAKVMELREPDPLDHGEAWRLAMEAVRKFSSYREDEALKWLADIDAALAYAVRTFGYRDLCQFNLRDESTVRAQFRDIYRQAAGRVAKNRAAGSQGPALPPSEGAMRRLDARKFIAGVSGAPAAPELPRPEPDETRTVADG